jgi:hypothetical protein
MALSTADASPSAVPLDATGIARAMVANVRWAARLGWDRYGEALGFLVQCPWTGPGATTWASAVAVWQSTRGLQADGIIGPQTWKVLATALAPPDSPTGVTPPDAPSVPDGFDQIIATFGDPRPLLSADGTITADNEARWQRKTLAAGELPFDIPIDPKNPAAGVKRRFWAHRKLVSTFVAVFSEIARLGLEGQVHSWGGLYGFRAIRGSTHLSLHAFGAAVDLNAETNPLGGPGDMSSDLIDVFEHFGFFWGGNFHSRPDPMHFQYATGY